MNLDQSVWLLLFASILFANIPWILEYRVLVFIKVSHKNFVVNFAEWFAYYVLMGVFAYLLEEKSMGHVQAQDWEFYAITFFMFMIFAFPGVIYRYNLKSFINKQSS